ncbi:50S ribosomal protein L4 [candidate division KSB1 bacterium 4484_87]|nr:MAG: 50S ribosomal protein L4 [candidate division KSB1 bacterium 4484_87]
MELDVYKITGELSGKKVKLPKAIFKAEPNDHLIYMAVRTQLWNRRQGTAATKNRALVRGGGKKPWRQKGRGTARAGTTRSPLWAGGGRIFGPQPRDLHMKITKKMKKLARISAYSYKAKEEGIVLVESVKLENPKTREMFSVLRNLSLNDKKVLFLTEQHDPTVLLAGRNIPNLTIRQAENASTYDILNCQVLLIEDSAIKKIKEVCSL